MYHNTTVVGNVGKDPERKSETFVTFPVAVNENWTDRATGEKREKTTWYNVGTNGKTADNVMQYVRKGNMVLVQGTVGVRAYTTNEGEARASLDLQAITVKFLTRPDGGGAQASPADDTNEIPF
jgi:single-strand DNA-binding protein